MDFMRLFIHDRLYLLPDDTQVRARLYNMEGLLLEWIFEDLSGVRKIGVLPDGRILGYIAAGSDQFGRLYETRPTDLTIDDLRAVEEA
jgi:hypothetical protein